MVIIDETIEKRNVDQYFDKYMIIDSFRKVECVQFERMCLFNPKVQHEVNDVTGCGVRLHVLQEHHYGTAK